MPSARSVAKRQNSAAVPRSPFGHRVLRRLRWAHPCERPNCIPITRPRGSKGQGLTYERLVAKQLPGAVHGQWFKFEDAFGPGFCQPDFIVELAKHIIVLECKLTDTPAAQAQLLDLYLPIVGKAYAKPSTGVVIVKNLRADSTGVVGTLATALSARGIPTLHWLGRSPLW